MKSSEYATPLGITPRGKASIAARLENEREDSDDHYQSDQKDDSDRSTDKFEHPYAPAVLRSSPGTHL
jgi:hypothetical protein